MATYENNKRKTNEIRHKKRIEKEKKQESKE
jgi:hypothetical protein